MDKSDNFGLSPDNDARTDTIAFQKQQTALTR